MWRRTVWHREDLLGEATLQPAHFTACLLKKKKNLQACHLPVFWPCGPWRPWRADRSHSAYRSHRCGFKFDTAFAHHLSIFCLHRIYVLNWKLHTTKFLPSLTNNPREFLLAKFYSHTQWTWFLRACFLILSLCPDYKECLSPLLKWLDVYTWHYQARYRELKHKWKQIGL